MMDFDYKTEITNEAATILKYIRPEDYEGKTLNGAEVGCLRGKTSAICLFRLPGLNLTMVDSFVLGPYLKGVKASEVRRSALEVCSEFRGRCRLVERDSVKAAEAVRDGSMDYVFIDADHSYHSVLKDLDAWWPKVKPGGLFLGHDYGQTVPIYGTGVKNAVDRWAAQRQLPVLVEAARLGWAINKPEGAR